MTKKAFREIMVALSIALALAVKSAAAEEYRLGIADRVKIKVQEWPDLGGEYAVTAEGFVSVPLVGNINVVGLRLDDLAREISDRLQRRGGDGAGRSFAAVEIVQYRPFSILGDVQRPGAYPYRPGLTVLEAVGIAGGFYRPEIGLLRLDRDMASAKGDLRTLSLKQNRLLAREARLTATLAGREDVPLSPEFVDQKDNPAISAIMEGERAALALDRNTERSEKQALEEVRSLYQREIESLHGQIDALAQERESVSEQLKQLRALSAKGLALTPTLFTLERSLAQVVNEQMSTGTAIVKAQENITLAEQQARDRSLKRNRDNEKDLQQTKDELAEVRARIRTAGDLLTEAQITAPAEARERLAERNQKSGFVLVRKDGKTTREIAADETTPVLPDDIIKVPMIRSQPQAWTSSINVSRAEGSGKTDR
jgi:protein involved in polysaccharide export with SLBB domain